MLRLCGFSKIMLYNSRKFHGYKTIYKNEVPKTLLYDSRKF